MTPEIQGPRRSAHRAVLGFAGAALCVSAGIWVGSAQSTSSERTRREQSETRGRELATLAAASTVEIMLTTDYPKLTTLAESFASALPDIAEVRVEDARGRTICCPHRGAATPSSSEPLRRFEAPI